MFITNDSLVIKTRVIRRIIDHDAVFVEGIKFNINATLHEQKRRMVNSLVQKNRLGCLKEHKCLVVHSTTCDLSENEYLWSS